MTPLNPQALDKRILTAAAEVTLRGLAKVVLLGDPTAIQAEAKKLAQDISKCTIVDPKVSHAAILLPAECTTSWKVALSVAACSLQLHFSM